MFYVKNYLLGLLLAVSLATNLNAQSSDEITIPLKNITVFPKNIEHSGSGVKNIADGKRNGEFEIFHTLWEGIPKQDIIIEAELEGKNKRIDNVVLLPRSNGYNGIIKKASLWLMESNTYKKVADIDAELDNAPIIIELNKPIRNPEKIKLIITDSYGEMTTGKYMVSLGELQCMMMGENAITKSKLLKDAEVFNDLTGTALKPEIKWSDINAMKVPALKQYAISLYKKTYTPGKLAGTYVPYLHPDILGATMRIGNGFSKYEGITGIVLEKGINIVFVGETNHAKIKLLVPDWTRKAPAGIQPDRDPAGWGLHSESFSLQPGVNYINLKKGGLAYIQYFINKDPKNEQYVTVHFPTGKYNGYFDLTRGDTDADFNKLLENTISPIMDLRGKYVQVAFPVDSLKKYTWNKGVELIKNYDTILGMQRKLMGWDKEGVTYKNHILARVNQHYYMFRDGDGIAFINWAMPMVADPKSVITGDPCWGFSHETGHVNQMRPQMTWGGMTEVSNNIFTMYCTTILGNESRLLEENKYEEARKTILDKGISYMDFPGKAGMNTNQYGGKDNTDVFQRLVPFWQLYLYFKEQGYEDFYPDLMIAMRKQPSKSEDNRNKQYLDMLEFCRLASEVSKTDLTDFFERWGFFYVGEIDVNDYVWYRYNVLQSDVDAVKKAIADMKLPKPKKDITLMKD